MKSLSTSINKATSAREKILFTAHDLFYQDGVRATGVDRLIHESKVTKTTFYRHFPSKKDLIIEFLELRHLSWLAWFKARIGYHGNNPSSITLAINEWLSSDDFRGCAFLNSVGELGEQMPEVLKITQRHKRNVVEVIASIVGNQEQAVAITVAIDGAVLKAQFDQRADQAVAALDTLVNAVS